MIRRMSVTTIRATSSRAPRTFKGALLVLMLVVSTLASLPIAGFSFVPAAAASGESSVKQALFYDSPNDGTSLATVAGRAKLLVFTRGKIGYLNDLRKAGFSGKALQYFLGNEVIGPWTTPDSGCDSSSIPVNNNVANQPGDFCKYIHPNESWFLHNGRGERLTNKHSDGRYSYHMNPASSGWREFARTRIARDLIGDSVQSKIGFDGIYLDNIALRLYKLQKQLSSSDSTVKEFGEDSAYRTAIAGQLAYYGQVLRPAGPLWANVIDDSGVAASDYLPVAEQLDGFLNEGWALGYPTREFKAAAWENMLSIAERSLAKGKGVFAVVQGDQSNTSRQRFGLASYLLVTNGSSAYFRYANASAYRQWWQYDNYNVSLGEPKGPRYQVGTAWRRDFACGYVTADPTTMSGTIVQSTCGTTEVLQPAPTPTEPNRRAGTVTQPGKFRVYSPIVVKK